jgi:hypothetical protein
MIKYIVALLLTVTAAHAQQQDPYAKAYADQRMKVFEQRKATYIRDVKMIFYAWGCHVNSPVGSAEQMIGGRELILFGRYGWRGSLPEIWQTLAAQFSEDREAAAQQGIATVKDQGCSYWTERDGRVYDFRQAQATALAMY